MTLKELTEYAEAKKALSEKGDNGYVTSYWTGYKDGVKATELIESPRPDRKEDAKSDDVSQWPDWKKRAALSNYEFGKED